METYVEVNITWNLRDFLTFQDSVVPLPHSLSTALFLVLTISSQTMGLCNNLATFESTDISVRASGGCQSLPPLKIFRMICRFIFD